MNRDFVDWFPRAENGVRLFEGEWSSALPGMTTGGGVPLFEDGRIVWFEEQLGSFSNQRVLELGPLEGGHSFMMAQRGADVLAIEANVRAYLRCLVTKELMGIARVRFLLGDFGRYLAASPPRFDFVLASGVLYHMTDPVELLRLIAKTSGSIGLWTHYYDRDVIQARDELRQKFDPEPRLATSGSRRVRLYGQRYLQALEWKGFCGGLLPSSVWLPREDILGLLDDFGFDCHVGADEPGHQNGPAFCVFARRR
jgi:hypothetical protein